MKENDMTNFNDEDFKDYSNEIQELNDLCKDIFNDKNGSHTF